MNEECTCIHNIHQRIYRRKEYIMRAFTLIYRNEEYSCMIFAYMHIDLDFFRD